jgi:hypothetical protein
MLEQQLSKEFQRVLRSQNPEKCLWFACVAASGCMAGVGDLQASLF